MGEINLMLLGEIFFLAEKYQVDAMKVSEANKNLVEFANAVDVLCVKFVLSLSIFKLSELFNMYQSEEEALVLHRLVSKVQKLKDKVGKKCKNCQKFPCITGSILTMHNCVPGARVVRQDPTNYGYDNDNRIVLDFKDNKVISNNGTGCCNEFRF